MASEEIELEPSHFMAVMIGGLILVVVIFVISSDGLYQGYNEEHIEYLVDGRKVDVLKITPRIFDTFIKRTITIRNSGAIATTVDLQYTVFPNEANEYIDIVLPQLPITVSRKSEEIVVVSVKYRYNNITSPQKIEVNLVPRVD